MLSYYYYKKDKNNITYSIDMVRYKFKLNVDLDCIDKFIYKYLMKDKFEIVFYVSKGVGYRYLYNIKIYDELLKSCSFVIGIGLNFNSSGSSLGFLEYNPNKCCYFKLFNEFLEDFFTYLEKFALVRYDLAIDFYLNRKFFTLSSKLNRKQEKKSVIDGFLLGRSVTEYSGRRNCNKFTKLYDKKAESHLDYDLTRLEYTFDRDETKFLNLPCCHILHQDLINTSTNFSTLNDSDLVLIDLLRNSDDFNFYYKRLGYRLRKKISPFLFDYKFVPDINIINELRNELITNEF